jgi:hypothetical protein
MEITTLLYFGFLQWGGFKLITDLSHFIVEEQRHILFVLVETDMTSLNKLTIWGHS